MNAKEILIRIRTEFKDQAILAAMVALDNLKRKAASLGQDLQLGLMTGQMGKGASAISTFGGALRSIPGFARGGVGGLQNFANGLDMVTGKFGNFLGAMRNGVKGLIGWNSVFGRVTMGMLTWHAWRTVASGFRAITDAVVGANIRMQTAEQMFTALSGGSEEIGGKYISIIRQLAVETGSSIDQLVTNAKRLPTQVGQNFEAFGELTKKAIVLGMLDPVQGVEGAMFSLSNFLEGSVQGARSLVQRFELFNLEMVKDAFREAQDPVEALDILFERAGIDVELLIEQLQNTMPVALQGIKSMVQELFRIIGEPAMDKVTEQVVRLRDFLRDNQAQIQGFGQALGDGIGRGVERAKNLLMELTGLDQFDAESWFDAGLEIVIQLSNGMLSAVTDYLLPAITGIANIIGGFFIGASPPPMGPLNKIYEGGKNTIKAYVEGLVAGLGSAEIKAMAGEILSNIIGLEAQALVQEKAIKELEKWVDEAGKAVEAKQREIKLFDLATEDIPERFTRARRRQLELELLAAQDEKARRKDALDIAKEQLKVTKDYIRAQEQVLRALEAQQKLREKDEKAEDAKKKGVDRGLKEFGIDDEKMKAEIAKWKEVFAGRLQPLFDTWKEGLSEVADFIRGFIGMDLGDGKRTEHWLLGSTTRQGIDSIVEGLTNLGNAMRDFATGVSEGWEKMPDGAKKLLVGIMAATIFPKMALLAGLGLTVEDGVHFDAKGTALIIAGLFGIGKGASLIGAASTTIGIVFSLGIAAAQGVASVTGITAILKILGIVGAGATGATVASLVLPISIVVGLITWRGKDIFLALARLDMIIAIKAIEGLAWLQNKIQELFPKWMFFQDMNDIDTMVPEAAAKALEYEKDIESWKQPWERLWQHFMPKAIEDAQPAIEEASSEALYGIPVSQADRAADAIVRKSIIPDMMDAIVKLWRNLPSRITPHLENLYSIIMRTMNMISFEWQMEWEEMVLHTENSLLRLTEGFMALEEMLQQLQYQNQQLEYGQAAAAAGTTQATGSRAKGQGSGTQVALTLDADETRRLMEEGTYAGISAAFGGS